MNSEFQPLPETGERVVPEASDDATFLDHLNRYRFAVAFARGKRVLDIACGEGYGASGLVRAGAARVVGIDIDPAVVAHARAKYGIDARMGRAEGMPVGDAEFDTVVSFETMEHLDDPGAFLREAARVLAPNGVLVLSTPNRLLSTGTNEFHRTELDPGDFCRTVEAVFPIARYFSQRLYAAPLLSVRCASANFTRPRFRPVSGLLYRARRRLCSEYGRAVHPALRSDPAGAIAGHRPTLWDRLLDLSRVRPWNPASVDEPIYLIAVATRR